MDSILESSIPLYQFNALVSWFLENKRAFPWRETPTPYMVWVSEVMLQQTRASVVVPYFERWMIKFPTVEALANAEKEEVIKQWEGLGYYSRARNLHEGAKQVVQSYAGILPRTREELLEIKGIGSYTAGAILSFAFYERAAAVDGNVKRVVSRLLCYEKDVAKGQSELEQFVEIFLTEQSKSHVLMEAFIELGAMVCKKRPLCDLCPMQNQCKAYAKGYEEKLPILPKRKETVHLHRFVLCLATKEHLLVKQEQKNKVMADLWEFPYFSKKEELLKHSFGKLYPLKEEIHFFTHHKTHLQPYLSIVDEPFEVAGAKWIERDKLKLLPFSSGHRRVLHTVLEELKRL